MSNDVRIVIGFIFILIVICKGWSLYVTREYKIAKERRLNLIYGFYINNIKETKIVGVGSDNNGDYDVSCAIKKVKLPSNIRIKANV